MAAAGGKENKVHAAALARLAKRAVPPFAGTGQVRGAHWSEPAGRNCGAGVAYVHLMYKLAHAHVHTYIYIVIYMYI